MPNALDIERLLAAANAAHVAGRLPEAERIAREILREAPLHLQANLLLGVLVAKTGRDDEAKEILTELHRREPSSFETVFWLSVLHRRSKSLQEAIRFARLSTQLRTRDAHAFNNLGLCLLDALELEEAAKSFQAASSVRSDLAPIFHNLGTSLYLLGRDFEAAQAFDRALLLSPRAIDSLLGLGQALISQTNPGEAVKVARRAITLDPNYAAAHLLMASALVEDNRSGEAEPHLRKAVELNPADAQAQALLGLRLQSLGRFKEANERMLKSLELEPNQGFAYFALVHNNKIKELDPSIVSKMSALEAANTLPPRESAFLEYGLGRAYENLGEYGLAIRHFDEANRLNRKIKFGDQLFDRAEYVRTFDWLIETFDADTIQAHKTANDSDLPIVIVGMMRSGTTLIEQILSSHPRVGAAGEQRFWPQNRYRLLGNETGIPNFRSLKELGPEYIARLKQVAPGFDRVTDKMPANYELAGPIHMALPNAKIIHMRRNPVDTCISIYTTPNRVPINFAYDRGNIVLAYRQYQRLMARWRAVLPPDRFLEVDYEALVADREAQTRKIVAYLGLEWSDDLLHHESNERNVLTPSLWQVRQPIYSTSVERWRRYEPWLGEFADLVAE
jgi:tetratricopeptide (TPR) repeat protein